MIFETFTLGRFQNVFRTLPKDFIKMSSYITNQIVSRTPLEHLLYVLLVLLEKIRYECLEDVFCMLWMSWR